MLCSSGQFLDTVKTEYVKDLCAQLSWFPECTKVRVPLMFTSSGNSRI